MKKVLAIIGVGILANFANAAISLSANELWLNVGETATVDIISDTGGAWCGYFGAPACTSV